MQMLKDRTIAVIIGVAMLVTLGGVGGAVAASKITGDDIKNGSVTKADLGKGSVGWGAEFNQHTRDKIKALAGQDGADGQDGTDGTNGKDGAQGPAGPAGPAGADGKAGPAGPAGPAGADGEDGVSGYGYMAPAWPAGHAYNPDGIYGTGPVTVNGTGKVTVLCPTGKSLVSAGAYAGHNIVTNSVRPVNVTGNGPFYAGGADIYVTTTKAVSVQPWAICANAN